MNEEHKEGQPKSLRIGTQEVPVLEYHESGLPIVFSGDYPYNGLKNPDFEFVGYLRNASGKTSYHDRFSKTIKLEGKSYFDDMTSEVNVYGDACKWGDIFDDTVLDGVEKPEDIHAYWIQIDFPVVWDTDSEQNKVRVYGRESKSETFVIRDEGSTVELTRKKIRFAKDAVVTYLQFLNQRRGERSVISRSSDLGLAIFMLELKDRLVKISEAELSGAQISESIKNWIEDFIKRYES